MLLLLLELLLSDDRLLDELLSGLTVDLVSGALLLDSVLLDELLLSGVYLTAGTDLTDSLPLVVPLLLGV